MGRKVNKGRKAVTMAIVAAAMAMTLAGCGSMRSSSGANTVAAKESQESPSAKIENVDSSDSDGSQQLENKGSTTNMTEVTNTEATNMESSKTEATNVEMTVESAANAQSANAGTSASQAQNHEPKDVETESKFSSEEDEAKADQYAVPEGFDAKKEGVEYPKTNVITYHSTVTGTDRKAIVLTPPDYDENKSYPVLYLLHGIGGDEKEWLMGRPEFIYGNLLAEGKCKEMIIVIPNVRARANDAANPSDIFTQGHFDAFDNFINDLNECLKPYIEENYSVATGRENTAVAGLSMGGRESLAYGLSHPEEFGYVGAFEPAPGVVTITAGEDGTGMLTKDQMILPAEYQDNTFIMIVKGTKDTVVGSNPLEYHKILEENGVEHLYYETEGGHEFKVWENSLYNFLIRVF